MAPVSANTEQVPRPPCERRGKFHCSNTGLKSTDAGRAAAGFADSAACANAAGQRTSAAIKKVPPQARQPWVRLAFIRVRPTIDPAGR